MYGALFIMAGAYTLSRDGHVRCDFVYRTWPYRVQAAIDLVLYAVFFLPVFLALLFYGIPFAEQSWHTHEVSIYTPAGAPVYPHKALIPIAGALMVVQCLAEIARCIVCLRDGVWPQRLHDVEEIESAILAEAEDRRHIEEELHVGAPR
jgi:TRAP-type mannitol/chloroaromatic compound transport system permease small subunit